MKRVTVILLSLMVLASCHYRETDIDYYDSTIVRINGDWSQFTKEVPTGMSVYCYPRQGGRPYMFLTNDIRGVTVSLPVGVYDILMFNQSVNEFGSMSFTGMDSFSTATAVLEDKQVSWKVKSPESKVGYEPEWLAVGRSRGLDVHYTSDTLEVTIAPKNVVYTGEVRVGIKGINNIHRMRGSLSGLAHSYLLGEGRTGSESITHVLETWTKKLDISSTTKGRAVTEFRCLGLPDMASKAYQPEDNVLAISFLLNDDATVCDFIYKVGNKIKIDGLQFTFELEIGKEGGGEQDPSDDADPDKTCVIPEVTPVQDGAGFSADVDDWGDEYEFNVPM